jgi:hypothetical protein
MPKNIENQNQVATGISVGSTDDVPEGTTNLYYSDLRAVSAVQSDTGYKNAEFIYGVPIAGPTTAGGQILISNGTSWNNSNSLTLNNSNLTVSSGPYAGPNAYYGRYGPNSYVKPIGNQKFLTIQTASGMEGFISLFITARETGGIKYQNSNQFYYQNIAGVLTTTAVASFSSPEYTMIITGTNLEFLLNTVATTARVTVTLTYQTVIGDDLTFTVP